MEIPTLCQNAEPCTKILKPLDAFSGVIPITEYYRLAQATVYCLNCIYVHISQHKRS